jgi:hypothetical protein
MSPRRTASRAIRRAVLPLFVFLLGLGSPADAGDLAEEARAREAQTLIERLAAFAEAKQKDEIERSLPRLVKLHNELTSTSVRADLLKAAARILGDEDLGGVRSSMATALGQVNDPPGAWKVLKGFLPSVKDEASGPFPLAVIQAVGALAPDAALATLLALMEKAADTNVSRYAIQALGKYGWSKQRVKVLGQLLDHLKRVRPGVGGGQAGKAGGEAARVRYNFLRTTLVVALDELTGQKFADVDRWLDAHKENRKALDKLFTFER